MKPSLALYFALSFVLMYLLLRPAPAPDRAPEGAPRSPLRPAALPPPPPPPAPPLPAAPAPAPPAAPHPACAAAPPYRGVTDPTQLAAQLPWAPAPAGAPARLLFQHAALSSPTCPRFLFVDQNLGAGAGHRLRQWSHGLFVAAALAGAPGAGIAHLHTSLDEGVGAHGGYAGLDELLGLALGERTEGALVGPGSSGWQAAPFLEARGIATVPLARVTEAPYVPNDQALAAWGAALAPPQQQQPPQCHAAYRLPMDQWAVDHATPTRALCAWKYAAAQVRAGSVAAARAAAGRPDSGLAFHRTLFPAHHWRPGALHVGVHYRVADGKLVPAEALAAVLSGTALPALTAALDAAGVAARTPIVVHVYSESTAPGAEAAALLALHGRAPAPGHPPLTVHHYGAQVGVLDTLWQLSQCDLFVGSVSSLSWAVAQFASRPLPLMQEFDGAGEYRWCLAHGVCCRGGACAAEAGSAGGERLRAAAERLARAAQCGQLDERSWAAPSMPEVEAAAAAEVAEEVAAAAAAAAASAAG